MTLTDIRDLKNGDFKAIERFLDLNNLYVKGEERFYPRASKEKEKALNIPAIPRNQELKLLAWTIAAHDEPIDDNHDDEAEAEVEEVEE